MLGERSSLAPAYRAAEVGGSRSTPAIRSAPALSDTTVPPRERGLHLVQLLKGPILPKDTAKPSGVTSLCARLERVQNERDAQSHLRVIVAQIERAERKCILPQLASAA
jgi:hypothetical protein